MFLLVTVRLMIAYLAGVPAVKIVKMYITDPYHPPGQLTITIIHVTNEED